MKKNFILLFVLVCLGSIETTAQYRYTVLHYFNDSAGGNPKGALTLSNGVLYGMTRAGGANHDGIIFSMDTAGTIYTDLMDFNGINGSSAEGSLTFSRSTMFGMTSLGGASGKGCIFKILTNGSGYADLLDFDSANGANPQDNVTLSGNKMYGMTLNGGAHNCGLIFSIDTNGANYVDLLDFDTANGAYPYGSLTLAGNVLYGTASLGGDSVNGCVFSVHIDGSNYKIMHSFSGIRGSRPYDPVGSLLLAKNMLYGMTRRNYALNPWGNNGAIFKIDTNGNTFTEMADPNALPQGSFILKDSVLYSMTPTNAGSNLYPHFEAGDVFSIDTGGGGYESIHGFIRHGYLGDGGCKSLTLATNGFYGMTMNGADSTSRIYTGSGVIFKLVDTGVYYPQVTMSIHNVSCNGGSNGTAIASVSGGFSPYTYFWQPSGNSTDSIGGLSAGTYTLSVTGNNDSTTNVYVTITQPAILNPLGYIIANVSCNGGNNGIDSVSGNGGASPFTYLWNDANSQTTATAIGLSAGTYTVSVSDSCGNSATTSVIITQPIALTMMADSSDATSGNCDGSAWVIVNGGTTPYTYSWTGGLTTDTILNQCTGDYCCTIADVNGCIDSICVNIDVSTGTNQLEGESEKVKVYPNPNDGLFTITLGHAELARPDESVGRVSASQPIVRIFNVLGQQVYFATLKQVLGDNFIDISSQPDGVYFYRVLSETGGLIGEGKLVIVK